MRFKLILSTVKADITDHIVDAAKGAGATGATIIPNSISREQALPLWFQLSILWVWKVRWKNLNRMFGKVIFKQ